VPYFEANWTETIRMCFLRCSSTKRTFSSFKELDQQIPTRKFCPAALLLTLQHQHIVTCQALEHTRLGDIWWWTVREALLRSLMQSEVHSSLFQSLNLIADVWGLEHAHERLLFTVILNQRNILLSLDTTVWIARISDFGIARLAKRIGNVHLNDTGSPAYMALW